MKNKKEELINAMVRLLEVAPKAFRNEENFMNHEYKNDIGPSYKGSVKESNKLLRFKEQFRSYIISASFGVQGKCEEVI